MPSGTALDTVQGAASSPGPGAVTNADVCRDCKEFLIDAEFKPCGHKLCCQSCADNFKKCKECKREITSVSAFLPSSMPICKLCEENKANIRMLPCNHVIVCHGPAPEDDVDADSSNLCNICFDNTRTVAFSCGHSCCNVCSPQLQECHICRKPITQKVTLYDN
eukprot:gene16584-18271_t